MMARQNRLMLPPGTKIMFWAGEVSFFRPCQAIIVGNNSNKITQQVPA